MNKIQEIILLTDTQLRETNDEEERKQLEVILKVLIDLRDNYKHHSKVVQMHIVKKTRQTTQEYL